MESRNSVFNYTLFLSQKSSVNKNDKLNYDYDKCLNLAIELKDSKPIRSVEILKKLYEIKKDPEVIKLLQELKEYNVFC